MASPLCESYDGVSALASSPNQAHAITHGCTEPPDIKDLIINVDLGGRQSRVSGQYCATIQKAVALIDRSSMTNESKQSATKALSDLDSRSRRAAAAKGQVNWNLSATCGTDGNCTFTGGIGGTF